MSARTMISVTELAARWGLDRKTVLEAIRAGQIPATKIGKKKFLVSLIWVTSVEQASVASGGQHACAT